MTYFEVNYIFINDICKIVLHKSQVECNYLYTDGFCGINPLFIDGFGLAMAHFKANQISMMIKVKLMLHNSQGESSIYTPTVFLELLSCS